MVERSPFSTIAILMVFQASHDEEGTLIRYYNPPSSNNVDIALSGASGGHSL